MTSYTNLGGTGNRLRYIQPSASGGLIGNPHQLFLLISGEMIPGCDIITQPAVGKRIVWDFGNVSFLIDQARWYQTGNNTHGDWIWQGSNDGGVTWTNIGVQFTLGGRNFDGTFFVQTQLSLTGNLVSYKSYSLLGVSGNTSNGPWIIAIEFKIDGPFGAVNHTSYENPAGAGYRQAVLTPPPPQLCACTLPAVPLPDLNFYPPYTLVNQKDPPDIGLFRPDGTWFWHRDPVAGDYFDFDFGFGSNTKKLVDEAVLWSSRFDSSLDVGTWQWRGGDGVTFEDIGAPFDLARPAFTIVQRFETLWANTKGYQHLRMVAIAPNALASSLAYFAFEFRIGENPIAARMQLSANDLALANALHSRWVDPTGAESPAFPLRKK
jgi:hypothetical protein